MARMGSELGKVTEPAQGSLISDLYPPDRRAGAQDGRPMTLVADLSNMHLIEEASGRVL